MGNDRVGCWAWFLFSLWKTFHLETLPEKRRLYITFAITFSIWFVAIPLVVIFAAVISPWWRHKTVEGIQLTINSLALLMLGIMLWPTRASEYFSIKPTNTLLSESGDSDRVVSQHYGTKEMGSSALVSDDNL